jgi:hypothetical protein
MDNPVCNYCGSTNVVIAKITLYSPETLKAVGGGMDYPTEYEWCHACGDDCHIIEYADFHERITNEN